MRINKILVVSMCVAACALTAWSQNTNRAASGIPGYLNPQTGAFSPMRTPSDEVNPPAGMPFTGKFVVNFTITIASTLSNTDVISCGVETLTLDNSSGFSFIEEATVAATRSGSSATCTVTLPYSWTLVSQPTDMVQLTFSLVAPASTAGPRLPNRLSTQTFAMIKVPANGATTTFTLTPTI